MITRSPRPRVISLFAAVGIALIALMGCSSSSTAAQPVPTATQAQPVPTGSGTIGPFGQVSYNAWWCGPGEIQIMDPSTAHIASDGSLVGSGVAVLPKTRFHVTGELKLSGPAVTRPFILYAATVTVAPDNANSSDAPVGLYGFIAPSRPLTSTCPKAHA